MTTSINKSRAIARSSSLLIAASVLALITGAANAQTPTVFAPDATVSGLTYGEWSAAWWQWAVSVPAPDSPLLDSSGQYCQVSQSGPVWFLAGSFSSTPVTRQCAVPSGQVVLFPIINSICAAEPDVQACASSCVDGTSKGSLKATIDGADVRGLKNFRAASPLFDIRLPGNNIFGAPPGVYSPSASDGFWLMVQLPPGNHVLHWEGAFVSGPSAGFSQNVTYNLTVR